MSSIWDSGWVIHDSEDMYPTKNPKRGIMGIVNDECLPHHWPTVSCCLSNEAGLRLDPELLLRDILVASRIDKEHSYGKLENSSL